MSGNPPAAPQRREIEIMRVLFERRLKDRATALADSRWPGSGRMVDLAYEWSQLTPAQRRDRLSAIGPEEISRLREFTALNPELAAAVDELDRRGVLPHIEAAAAEATAAAQAAYIPGSAAAQEMEVPATDDAGAVATAGTAEPDRTAMVDESPETEVEFDFEDAGVDALDVVMPVLDLGLPSTSEFMQEREDQRQRAIAAAEATMERVRQRLDQSTQRAFQRSAALGAPRPAETAGPQPSPVVPDTEPSGEESRTVRAIAPPATLLTRLRDHPFTALSASDRKPSDDELLAIANELRVGYAEFALAPGRLREMFGGLTISYGQIEVVPGPLPRAIAEPNLVVIRGRLSPQTGRRIAEGFLDIPGTRASVRVHPDTRVLILPS
jgi:hypothetical protein